jgi:hypothetical protein
MSFCLRIGLLGLACAGTATACARDTRLPESCEDIQRDFLDEHDDFPDDGEYTLYVDGEKSRPWTVWCEAMNRDEPKDYLTVKEADNASEVSDGIQFVRTSFERVRIDPVRLEIDPWDFAFATTIGDIALLDAAVTSGSGNTAFRDRIGLEPTATAPTNVPLGVAYRGEGDSVARAAQSHVDLAGTGFSLAEDVTEDDFFCTRATPLAVGQTISDLSLVRLDEDLDDVQLVANTSDATDASWAAAECDDFSDSTRIPVQYNGLD